jgi:hypothetical protein
METRILSVNIAANSYKTMPSAESRNGINNKILPDGKITIKNAQRNKPFWIWILEPTD